MSSILKFKRFYLKYSKNISFSQFFKPLFIVHNLLYYFIMIEYFTEALVLDKEDSGEIDGLVHFYTEELGKVTGKARGVKKMTSKLNAHLEPIHFVKVRLISGKNGYFQIADTLSFKKELKKEIKNSPENLAKFLRISRFIKDMTFEMQTDFGLWQAIKKIFSSNAEEFLAYRLILKNLGFDPEYAACDFCGNKKISYFHQQDHNFLCQKCASPCTKEARHHQTFSENTLLIRLL